MSDFPSLAEVLEEHRAIGDWQRCRKCGFDQRGSYAEHVADAWREACTIRTVEELDALPAGCVIHTKRDGAVEKFSDGHWYLPGRRDAVSFQRVISELPARLISHPAWERP